MGGPIDVYPLKFYGFANDLTFTHTKLTAIISPITVLGFCLYIKTQRGSPLHFVC